VRRGAALLVLAAGCVGEYDVDTWAVLPQIPHACETLGAARATFEVHPLDEPSFALVDEACSDDVGGHGFAGFHVQIGRLTTGYHRLDVTITGVDDAMLGRVSRPFSAHQPLVVVFSRGDLPGWPTAAIDVAVPACAPGSPIHAVTLTATPALASAPIATLQLACTTPAAVMLTVPVGPVTLAAAGVDVDGQACWSGTLDGTAPAQAAQTVSLLRSCP
jgi:hypothetical protein